MKEKDLDLWFNSLGLDALARMFVWPKYQDANDFIDICDEYWESLPRAEKEDFYLRHN